MIIILIIIALVGYWFGPWHLIGIGLLLIGVGAGLSAAVSGLVFRIFGPPAKPTPAA